MKARKVRALRHVAALGVVAFLSSACGAGGGSGSGSQSGPIKVGFVVPYSGSVARYGQDADEAWALAAEKYGVNVNGRTITPVKYDDKCTPAAAASAVKQALGSGVVALYGPTCSGNVLATQQMAAQSKVPMITGAYSPDITAKGNKYIWRMPPSDAVLNGDLAKFLVKKGWTEVGVLHDNTGFGQAEGKTITDGYKAQGVTSKIDLTYQVGATDFSGEIQRLKSAGVKTVCLEGYDPDTARIALQMHQLGLDVNVCGNQEISYDDSLKVAGEVLNGSYYYSVYLPDSKQLAPFTTAWRAKYNADPNPEQYEYYLGAVAVIQAIKSIKGNVTAEAVNAAISKLHFDVEGFATLAFTDTGDPKCPTVLVGTIANGKPQTVQEDSAGSC
ncbi:MAG: ethanolamine utilization protein EutJ [Dactylosporangium sp.]|jgi:branched-chain amino acid transport system substrate-binding protein|nr:ethanolamine utilization protein EutJ [Dactylosporangium sp.]